MDAARNGDVVEEKDCFICCELQPEFELRGPEKISSGFGTILLVTLMIQTQLCEKIAFS